MICHCKFIIYSNLKSNIRIQNKQFTQKHHSKRFELNIGFDPGHLVLYWFLMSVYRVSLVLKKSHVAENKKKPLLILLRAHF